MSQIPAKDFCGQNSGYDEKNKYSDARMFELGKRMKYNPLGRVLIEFAMLAEVEIHLTNEISTAGLYMRNIFDDHIVYLNADCDDHTLFVALAHELRHLAQNLTLQHTLHDFSLKEAIALNRFMEADASAYSNAVALAEYDSTGDARYLKASKIYMEQDIMRAIQDAMIPGTPVEHNESALRAGFNAWFKNRKRVKHYDAEVKQERKQFKDTLAAQFYIKRPKTLSEKFIRQIGAVVPGVNYLTGKRAPKLMSKKYRPTLS